MKGKSGSSQNLVGGKHGEGTQPTKSTAMNAKEDSVAKLVETKSSGPRFAPLNLQEDGIVDLEDLKEGDDKGEVSGDRLAESNEVATKSKGAAPVGSEKNTSGVHLNVSMRL